MQDEKQDDKQGKKQDNKYVELKTLFQKKKPDYPENLGTVVIEVDLIKPTNSCYTEINYPLEVEMWKAKNNISTDKQNYSILDGLNSDDKDDVNVRNTAAKFEAKYGKTKKYSSSRNHESDFEDYESDSFIDNSEAYEEVIPPDFETLYGGVYINTHPGPGIYIKKEPKKKPYNRIGEYRDVSIPVIQVLKELKQDVYTFEKGKMQLRNKQELIREIEEEIEEKEREKQKSKQTSSEISLNSFENLFQKIQKENKENDLSQIQSSSSDSDQRNLLQNEIKLPTNLPSEVAEIVENIKKVCEICENSSQDKVRNRGLVNNQLIKLEYKCKRLAKSIRVKVYDYLAPFVKCKRKSLTKRAKNLHVNEEYRKANELLETFKNAVTARTTSLQNDRENKAEVLFVWNDETTQLLKDVINLRRNCFRLEGKRNDRVATRLVEFVKVNLLSIWTEGWMSASGLLDYYDSVSNEDEKLSVILKQSNSAFDLPDSIAPFQGNPSSTETFSNKPAKNIDASASKDIIVIDLTD